MAAGSSTIENATEAKCKNCGTSLAGRYCCGCGQPERSVDPSLHDFLHELVHEFAHLDGKIVATLKALIFTPGKLSAEFFAGRRASYIGPVRLYLTFSVVFFLAVALQSPQVIINEKVNGKSATREEIRQTIETEMGKPDFKANSFRGHMLKAGLMASEEPELVHHKFVTNASRAAFFLVPMFALGLLLAYKNSKKHYPTFIYFSLHFHAFAFFAATFYAIATLTKAGWLGLAVGIAVAVWMAIYLFLALRRTFGGSRVSTLVRMAGLAAFYIPCYAVAVGVAALVTVYTI